MSESKRMMRFLARYKGKSTEWTYTSALEKYFSLFVADPDAENKIPTAEKCEIYFAQNKSDEDYMDDVELFYASLQENPPRTILMYLSVIRTFFRRVERKEFSSAFWDDYKPKERDTVTQDRIPTKNEFKQIFNHMPIWGKAFYMCLLSSGMRIGEAASIKLEDIDLTTVPATIYLRRANTKGNRARTVHISSEAVKFVNEWLKVRDEYIGSGVDNGQLFPMVKNSLRNMFSRAVQRTRLDERCKETNRRVLHPHVTRKYFRTHAPERIPIDIVEALLGHKGYLSNSYVKLTPEQIAKAYHEGEEALYIYDDIEKLDEKVQVKTRDLRIELDAVKVENAQLMKLVTRLMTDLRRREREDQEYEIQQRAAVLQTLSA